MTRNRVQSSNIFAVGYDEATLTMQVEFANGSVYEYAGVRPEHHAAFVGAESIGRHFASHIRGKYEGERVDTPAPAPAESGVA